MNTEAQRIEIRGLRVEIVRKNIKNLHVGVYPPNGRVRIAAPFRLSNDAVRLAVISRLSWVRRQQAKFQQQERQSRREMVSGETHFVQGRRYRLNVTNKDDKGPKVWPRTRDRLELRVDAENDRERREEVLNRWYRDLLREQLPELVKKWQPRIGVQVNEWRIRKMKTRWGTCNREAGRIWINLSNSSPGVGVNVVSYDHQVTLSSHVFEEAQRAIQSGVHEPDKDAEGNIR